MRPKERVSNGVATDEAMAFPASKRPVEAPTIITGNRLRGVKAGRPAADESP